MFSKKAWGQKVQLKKSGRDEEVSWLWVVKSCSPELKPHTPQISITISSLFSLSLLLFGSAVFSEYKIIRLRLDGRGQTSAGVHGSNFTLAAKLLQHSLFSVQENRSAERHQPRRAYRSARGWALLIRRFCSTSLCTVFLQFCQPGNYMSLMVYVQLVLLGINNKKAD